MISFHSILEHYGITPKSIRLVRHGDGQIPILKTFRLHRERFDVYQKFQNSNRFGDSKHIAVFAPMPANTALFLGLYDINGCVATNKLTDEHSFLIEKFKFPKDWIQEGVFYELALNPVMDELSERLVIDWGAPAIAYIRLGENDKDVLEIKRPNSVSDFISYSEVKLDHYELKKIILSPNSNLTWKNALSSVNGIYLIRDKSTGKLYVGSAYGEQGIFGRWKQYAKTGHGDNEMLKVLDHDNFEFSILEITPLTLSTQEVVKIENKWKDRLGTWLFDNLNSMELHGALKD